MIKSFIVSLVFIFPTMALSEFNQFDVAEKRFLREALLLPYTILLSDNATGNCWTNLEESRKAIWRPLSEIGIEFARATFNYIAVKVEGQRYNSECVGHISIQLLTDATPVTAKWSSKKAPTLRSEVISVSELVLSADNLNEEILGVLKGFSNSLTTFLKNN